MSEFTEILLVGGANDGRRVQVNNVNRQAVLHQVIPRSKLKTGPEVGDVTFNSNREMSNDMEAYSLVSLSIGYGRYEIYLHQGVPVKEVMGLLLSGYRRIAP